MCNKLSIHPEDPSVRILYPEKYPEYPVYILLPESYHEEKKNGLFFFMHGGDRSSTPDQPYKSYLSPETGTLRPHLKNFPYLTAAPAALKAVDGKRWNREGVSDYILALIGEIRKYFNVDPDRMILGGHSMGGFGAYHQGALLADRFAGIWCSAGAWLEEDFRTMEGCGIYIAHGKYDCALHYKGAHKEPRHHDWCGVSFARAAHELMNRYGIRHVYDEHDGGHTLDWEPCQMSLCRFLQWAQKQKRNPYPVRCSVVTPNGSCDPDLEEKCSNYYLQILQTDPEGVITLDKIVLTGENIAWTIDEFNTQSYFLRKSEPRKGAFLQVENESGNRFHFRSENVKTFKLYLHPLMADPAKEICLFSGDGKEYRVKPQEDHTRNDYTASVTVSI